MLGASTSLASASGTSARAGVVVGGAAGTEEQKKMHAVFATSSVLSFANQLLQDAGCIWLCAQLQAVHQQRAAAAADSKSKQSQQSSGGSAALPLTELDLRGCSVGAAGAKALADVIRGGVVPSLRRYLRL
jgi:hypothetical protein